MVLERISDWFVALERRIRRSFGKDISSPWQRFLTWVHFQLFDHAFLRVFWTNFDEVAPGVFRSNHPGPKRLKRYKDRGIKSVLNLRGQDDFSPWLFEAEACEKLGLNLQVAKLYARKAARQPEVVHLIDTMRTIEKPFVMHCKSGADRAGLASVIYQHVFAGIPLEEARKQLSWRYIHFENSPTGICDHIVDMYTERNARDPIDMETWFRTEYDHRIARESFAAKRGRSQR